VISVFTYTSSASKVSLISSTTRVRFIPTSSGYREGTQYTADTHTHTHTHNLTWSLMTTTKYMTHDLMKEWCASIRACL
jgi:hypothetical protein